MGALPFMERAIHGRIPVSGSIQGHWSIQIFPENKEPRDWSVWIPLRFIWINGSQISLKVLVCTGHGMLFSVLCRGTFAQSCSVSIISLAKQWFDDECDEVVDDVSPRRFKIAGSSAGA